MQEEIPSSQEYYTTFPLYQGIRLSEENASAIQKLLNSRASVDTFCPDCNEKSTFQFKQHICKPALTLQTGERAFAHNAITSSPFAPTPSLAIKIQGLWVSELACSRETENALTFRYTPETHTFFVFTLVSDTSLMKIGQYPSIRDMEDPSYKRFRKVIGADDVKEIGTALGLYAHGVGVGSYVYLRRVYERLVLSLGAELAKEEGWENKAQQKFYSMRMDEKIERVLTKLPDDVEHYKPLYAFLSKGVHELSDKECLAYFEPVKDFLFMILDDLEAAKAKQESRRKITASLNKIVERHSGSRD